MLYYLCYDKLIARVLGGIPVLLLRPARQKGLPLKLAQGKQEVSNTCLGT